MKEKIIKTELITAFMKTNNLSKTAFCAACKISLNTLNKILENQEKIRLRALFKIARVLNIKAHELFIE